MEIQIVLYPNYAVVYLDGLSEHLFIYAIYGKDEQNNKLAALKDAKAACFDLLQTYPDSTLNTAIINRINT